MPVMGDVEALQAIRVGYGGQSAMPIIALTADAMSGLDAELLAADFDDVAPRPINPGESAARIWRPKALRKRPGDCEAGGHGRTIASRVTPRCGVRRFVDQ